MEEQNGIFTMFVALLSKKSKSKFILAPFKLLTNFENPLSNPLRDPKAAILNLKVQTGSRL
jgi:hypothetical protein